MFTHPMLNEIYTVFAIVLVVAHVIISIQMFRCAIGCQAASGHLAACNATFAFLMSRENSKV